MIKIFTICVVFPQHKLLSDYMYEDCHLAELKALRCIESPTVLPLKLKTDKVEYDSGVYIMRIMETYKGGVGWKCGFKRGSRKDMPSLRVEYLHNLLNSDINQDRDAVMPMVKKGGTITHVRMG